MANLSRGVLVPSLGLYPEMTETSWRYTIARRDLQAARRELDQLRLVARQHPRGAYWRARRAELCASVAVWLSMALDARELARAARRGEGSWSGRTYARGVS